MRRNIILRKCGAASGCGGKSRPMHSKRLARRAALCYTVGEIRAARRAVRDIAVYRTYCRTKKEGRHIRAAKRQIEPRSARLPEARISKPHPRKGTETPKESAEGLSNLTFQNHIPARGRKRFQKFAIKSDSLLISKPHPRKGTECANPSLPCRSGGGGPCEAWWKGRLERSAHLHREKGTSAASAPTGSHRSPPPPSDGGGK